MSRIIKINFFSKKALKKTKISQQIMGGSSIGTTRESVIYSKKLLRIRGILQNHKQPTSVDKFINGKELITGIIGKEKILNRKMLCIFGLLEIVKRFQTLRKINSLVYKVKDNNKQITNFINNKKTLQIVKKTIINDSNMFNKPYSYDAHLAAKVYVASHNQPILKLLNYAVQRNIP